MMTAEHWVLPYKDEAWNACWEKRQKLRARRGDEEPQREKGGKPSRNGYSSWTSVDFERGRGVPLRKTHHLSG